MKWASGQPLIITGASARAAAQSAIRAGYLPWCVDLFADRDLQQIASVRRCPLEKYPYGLLPLLDDAPAGAAVLCTGALENHPRLLQALSLRHRMISSGPAAVRRIRAPLALASLPRYVGLATAKTRLRPPRWHGIVPWLVRPCLIKPICSTGGRGIRRWSAEQVLGPHEYLQRYVQGVSISAVYVADGWSSSWLGASEQLIGDGRFGAEGYRYCGSVGPLALGDRQRRALIHLGVVLTQRFDLRGPFGVDAVLDQRGVIWPVEVNPRYPASLEVLERSTGVVALAGGAASPQRRQAGTIVGKAIVFARRSAAVPDLYQHVSANKLADVPESGTTVSRGWPICTVLAQATDRRSCVDQLLLSAAKVYQAVGEHEPTVSEQRD